MYLKCVVVDNVWILLYILYIYIVTDYVKAYKKLKSWVLRLVSDIFPVLILQSW